MVELSEMMTTRTTSSQAQTFVLFAEWAGPVSAVLIVVEPEVYIVHLKYLHICNSYTMACPPVSGDNP